MHAHIIHAYEQSLSPTLAFAAVLLQVALRVPLVPRGADAVAGGPGSEMAMVTPALSEATERELARVCPRLDTDDGWTCRHCGGPRNV